MVTFIADHGIVVEGKDERGICQTELAVVRYLYTDGEGGWDAGAWV